MLIYNNQYCMYIFIGERLVHWPAGPCLTIIDACISDIIYMFDIGIVYRKLLCCLGARPTYYHAQSLSSMYGH